MNILDLVDKDKLDKVAELYMLKRKDQESDFNLKLRIKDIAEQIEKSNKE